MPWWNAKNIDKRKPPRTGMHNSEEQNRKIAIGHQGKHSPERCEINRKAHIGITSPLIGKTLVEIFGEERAQARLEQCRRASAKGAAVLRGRTELEIYGEERAAELAAIKSKGIRAAKAVGKNENARDDYRYKAWQDSVFTRDNFTCQDCSVTGQELIGQGKTTCAQGLHAHHLKEWEIHISLRYEITNGITLCSSCHRKRHHKARKEALVKLVEIAERINDLEMKEALLKVKEAFWYCLNTETIL
jgi:5-methylcytosine-specific restriction endonuclease McrA